ncbi:hypothetical protein [Candidatus Trichorickettsia mobilis]|uniref:hypothetical protein n=1 Tax=Candidatus Trichorickettsia mobilis TaxID=1346319 RepID=UPI00292E9ED8|nr:hypothetical protein [Candidatus Trichorickettsia mobilis]
MPDPDDEEHKVDQESFNPSKEGNFDKVARDSRYGKLYRDVKTVVLIWIIILLLLGKNMS